MSALERQLDHIAARNVDHLAMTGDLLDRWDPRLLARLLDAVQARGLLDAERLTILHGNHDLASSGGHPRHRRDIWRLAWRFWDPPPLVAARQRSFYGAIRERAEGVASPSPWTKTLSSGLRIVVLDTVPVHWWPIGLSGRQMTVNHAVGCTRESELAWLRHLRGDVSTLVLIHHYPLDAPQFTWQPTGRLRHLVTEVQVPTAIPEPGRTELLAGARAAQTRLLLCGHIHRARLDWKDGLAVGLNGQSGADWAGRTVAFYRITPGGVDASFESC